MRARRALAAACLALALGVPAAAAEGTRTPLGRVELVGPLQRVELGFPDGSGTTVAIPLASGEHRTLTLPLPSPSVAPDAQPRITVEGVGSARFAGWVGDDLTRLRQEWERLPPGLRLRPRPPALEDAPQRGPPLAALLVACAAFLLALRLRRRGLAALGVGLVGAAATYALGAPSQASGRELSVLEGDGTSEVWLAVHVGRERLVLEPADALRLETRPPRAVLDVLVDEGPHGLRWTLRARGATLDRLDLVSLEASVLTREGPNRLGALTQTWVRDGGGTWTRRGPWPAGATLPDALPGPGEPPGWMNPALPMGVGVLVARRSAASAEVEASGKAAERWVRVVGF